MLIGEGKALTVEAEPEAHKDARIYAAVPFRAATDRKLLPNDLRVLMLVCGFAKRGSQTVWPAQGVMAQILGVSDVLVYRHMMRLVAHGYLVQLAPKVRGKLATIYGIIYDPNNPPTKHNTDVSERSLTQEGVDVSERSLTTNIQPVKCDGVRPTVLQVAWRQLGGGGYIANELEVKYWRELAILGCTVEHLAAWYAPGKPSLIGYYMQQARRELATA